MRIVLAALWLLLPMSCLAGGAESGNYIIVRGAISGCEAWDDRILDIVEVEKAHNPTILGIPDIDVVGKSEEEIEMAVLIAIESETGTRPQTLSFELVGSVLDLKPLIAPYLYSSRWLEAGVCPPNIDRRNTRENWYEEQIEKLRRAELARTVV
jgi:hypothetical protein